MTHNSWSKNFPKAVYNAVYIKPILGCLATYVMALALCELGKWAGVVDRSDWSKIILFTFMGVMLIYVLTVSAKIDMLKRTVDQNARYRETKALWLDKTEEPAPVKETTN